MLGGLEVTTLRFKEIRLGDRADAEYYSKENIAIENELADHHAKPLGDYCTVIASAFYPAATDLYESGDVPFARCVDCVQFPVISRLQDDSFERIPRWFMEGSGQIQRVKQGDIIITKVGTPCFASVVHDYQEIALSRTVLGLTNLGGINAYYLVAFLRSRYGFSQLTRERELTIQYQLTLERIRDVLVFEPSSQFQLEIEQTVLRYIAQISKSGELSGTAEKALTRALGLENWQAPEPLTYTRSSRDAFAAERLDSEYFAPRVSQLLARLSRDGLRVGDVAPARHRRFVPASTGSFNYIEIGGVRADGTAVAEPVEHAEAPSRASQMVEAGDVITSTVRPIRRLSALVVPEQHESVCSSGFVVLQPTGINAETLLTYLRLRPICELMDLHTSASLYPAISEADLQALPIPRIDKKTQLEVSYAVNAAQAARQRAAQLLDAAKRAVEVAIEDSETAALLYIKGVEKCQD